jgi:putative membrane protein
VYILFAAWYFREYINRYYYSATDSYITIKKGVFTPAEIHVQFSKIQDVYVDQDILDRMMGLYDVHLASATAASGIEAHIDGVEQAAAEGLKNFLLQKLQSGGATDVSSGQVPPSPISNASQPAAFAGEISSRTYPIVFAWFVPKAIWGIFYSLLIAAYPMYLLLAPPKYGGMSPAEAMNLAPATLLDWYVLMFAAVLVMFIARDVLWRASFSFIFLPDYVVTTQGILSKKETHLPYRAVQDVTVSQGIVDRMLGIATVEIENAAVMQVAGKSAPSSAIVIPGQPLAKANEISDALRRVTLTKNASQTGL